MFERHVGAWIGVQYTHLIITGGKRGLSTLHYFIADHWGITVHSLRNNLDLAKQIVVVLHINRITIRIIRSLSSCSYLIEPRVCSLVNRRNTFVQRVVGIPALIDRGGGRIQKLQRIEALVLLVLIEFLDQFVLDFEELEVVPGHQLLLGVAVYRTIDPLTSIGFTSIASVFRVNEVDI